MLWPKFLALHECEDVIMSLPTPNVNRSGIQQRCEVSSSVGRVLVPLFGGLELLVLILGSKNKNNFG